ncbi:MAG: hypothetical protein FGM41_03010 [Bacteroidetes bacterium]|nr:hypothetical protein [Bacteroidota bacterium]
MKQICYLVFFQEYFHQAGVQPTNSSNLCHKLGDFKRQIDLQKFEDEIDDILLQYRMNLFHIMGQLETAWLLFIIAMQLVQERVFTEEEFDLIYMEFSSTDGPKYQNRFFYERANVFLIGGYGIGEFYSTDVFSTI